MRLRRHSLAAAAATLASIASVAAIACGAALGGCAKSPAPAEDEKKATSELATVEVTAAPDAAYSTAEDRVERRPKADAMAGALPDGFPSDIPVFRPSSLIDFVARSEGGYMVLFASPASASTVSTTLAQKLGAAGWQPGSSGAWTKGGRRLRLAVESSAAGSRIRIEF